MFKKYSITIFLIYLLVLTPLWSQTNKPTVFVVSNFFKNQSLQKKEQLAQSDTIDISIPRDLEGTNNKIIKFPVNVDDSLTNYAINTYQFTLTFDPYVLEFQNANDTNTLTQPWEDPHWESPAPGKVTVGGYGLPSLSCPPSPPPLVYLYFLIIGESGMESELHFESFSFNISDLNIQTHDGFFRVLADSETVQIKTIDSWAGPRTKNHAVEIELKNLVGVYGTQFTSVFNGTLLSCVKVDSTKRSSHLQIASKIWSDSVRVLVFSAKRDSLSPGDGSILRLFFDIDSSASPGDSTLLYFSEVKVSGRGGTRLEVITDDGWIFFGKKGDINSDGEVDIYDLIVMIDIILCIYHPTPYEFWAADMDDNGEVDIYDLVRLAEQILGDILHKSRAEAVFSPAHSCQIRLPKIEFESESSFNIPVLVALDGAASGVQLKISYDPQAFKISSPFLTHFTDQMEIASYNKNGELTILIYSSTGEAIHACSEPIISIPLQVLGSIKEGLYFNVDQAIVINSTGEKIPVEIISGINSSLVPKNYYLAQNYPNPFNSQTWIEYQIPEAGRVTLKIFNLLGEEVRTLVDREMETGNYKILWDGKDTHGRAIPSGTYIYRFQTNNFDYFKKAVLLK